MIQSGRWSQQEDNWVGELQQRWKCAAKANEKKPTALADKTTH